MISRSSGSLVISVTISLNSLGTSVIVTDSTISITMISRCSGSFMITITSITSSKSFGGSVDIAMSSISIPRFSLTLPIAISTIAISRQPLGSSIS